MWTLRPNPPQANIIAREMVYRCGFSKRLGPVSLMDNQEVYINRLKWVLNLFSVVYVRLMFLPHENWGLVSLLDNR